MSDWVNQQQRIAIFTAAHFWWRITPVTGSRPQVPLDLSVQTACDCIHIAEIAAVAFRNPISLQWNIEDYVSQLGPKQSGLNSEAEDKLAQQFPVPDRPDIINKPAVVVDSKGHIVLWYLPNGVSKQRQSRVWTGLPILNDSFKKPCGISETSSSWRGQANLFYSGARHLRPGLLNFSPAWYQTGHENGLPEVSATLKHSESTTLYWTRNNREFSVLMGALLAIAHPDLYKECITSLKRFEANPTKYIKNSEAFSGAIEAWGNPFGGLALISNRETPTHRDNNSRYYWYDILTTLGEYNGLEFSIPGLGARFLYNPGTILALSGRAFTHQVPLANGERICFAYFIRDKVLRHGGFSNGSWPVYGKTLLKLSDFLAQ